jgi:tRNA (guanine37-N1)-methyltransferase
MRLDLVSIFPEYFTPLTLSLLGKAQANGLVDVHLHDLRSWATDRHHTVDDTPYGGGAGMVMRPEPWGAALDFVLETGRGPGGRQPLLVVPTPSGQLFTQSVASEMVTCQWLVFACGRYEGIDQRVVDHYAQQVPVVELSLGDYVVSGGEVAALAMIEAVVRLLPGVVGNPASLLEESHGDRLGEGRLEYPVYTKPAVWRGHAVPDVLLSGDHARVTQFRRAAARRRTALRRPDLLGATPDAEPSGASASRSPTT